MSRAKSLCDQRPAVSAAKRDDAARADAIVRGKVSLMGSPVYEIGGNPTWREGISLVPFHATLHGLAWTDVLRRRWLQTGDHRYLARYERLLRSWVAVAGDPAHPLTRWTWFDMSQGQRAAEFACAVSVLGPRPWLMGAVRTAQNLLLDAQASHYDGEGNHSLWQDMGLVTLSRLIRDERGSRIAIARMGRLLRGAVSADGESTEGASVYQELNWLWWTEAAHLVAPARIPGGDRIAAMAQVYADLLTPAGSLLAFGDSQAERSAVHSIAIPRPRQLSLMPSLGLAQARSNEMGSMAAVRFGAAGTRQLHGHRDAGSIQFHACGRTLLGDGGMYAYAPSTVEGQRARSFVQSAAAHSLVLPTGTSADPSERTSLQVHDSGDAVTFVLGIPLASGTSWVRRVYYSRVLDVLLVEDEVPAGGRQLWQLPRESSFTVTGSSIFEAGPIGGCRLSLTWVRPQSAAVVTGGDGIGWMSEDFGTLIPRPTAVASVAAHTPTAVLIEAVRSPDALGDSTLTAIGDHRYLVSGVGRAIIIDMANPR